MRKNEMNLWYLSFMYKGIVSLYLLLLLFANGSGTTCKSTEFVGMTINDIGTSTPHGPNLIIFYGNKFKIDADGYLLGWTVYLDENVARGQYLDLWRLDSAGYWVNVNKTKLLTNAKRNHSVGFQEEIKVKAGDVIGNHAVPGKKVGTAYRSDPSTNGPYPITLGTDIHDGKLENAQNKIKKTKHSTGRLEAIGAHVLADKRLSADAGCDMRYVQKTGISTFKAFHYSTITGNTRINCAIGCSRLTLCLTFTFQASNKECKLFSKVWEDFSYVGNAPTVTLATDQKLYVTTE